MFQPVYRCFKKIANSDYNSTRKSKGLSDESKSKPYVASNNSFAPGLNHIKTRLQVKIDGLFLEQVKTAYTQKPAVNIYIVYKINMCSCTYCADFTL